MCVTQGQAVESKKETRIINKVLATLWKFQRVQRLPACTLKWSSTKEKTGEPQNSKDAKADEFIF